MDMSTSFTPGGPAPTLAAAAASLVEHVHSGVIVIQDGLLRYANPAFCALVDWPARELLGRHHHLTLAPESHAVADAVLERRLAGSTGRAGLVRCLRRDGRAVEVKAQANRIDFLGRPAVLVTVSDVSGELEAMRRAEWNAGMLRRTETLCRSGSFEIRLPEGELTMSAGLCQLVGHPADAGAQAQVDALPWVPPNERAYVAGFWRSAPEGEPFEFQHRVQCADGSKLLVLHLGIAERCGDGSVRGVAILKDITAQHEAQQRIEELSNQDEVTGLPNRSAFLGQVDAAIHAARWEDRSVALLSLEVPRIAEIKTSMGFGAGDTLAMAVAARLQGAAGEGESVAHLGDTEFALLLECSGHPADEAITARAQRLLDALQVPVQLGRTDIYPQCFIGISCFPRDAAEAAPLLECAQTARMGTGMGTQIGFVHAESNARALREMALESALNRGIANNELRLHYQPEVDLATGRVCGAEALLRWTSAELGSVSPAEFIPLAERVGLIGTLGDWVLNEACQQIAAWRRAGLPPVRISVNMSPMQLQRPDLARHLQSVLVRTGADPTWLGIEVTESTLMADLTHASALLRDIKSIGIEVSLDDFGTGFSSLSSLARLPIDIVKVDRSFVHDVAASAKDVSVTRAIISMAHGLQMQVLAEGVETEDQLGLLVAGGCDKAQGFWFSPPLPVEDFERLLREERSLPNRFIARARKPRTLLLVDDEENILSSLRRLLRRDGYHIVTATSAAEGLKRLAEHEVDVIVSDQRMPNMTGVEFLRQAKALYPDTVRMVLSGYTELQSIIDAVNEGAIYRFLTKPWDDERLREHIAEAFRAKGLADENRRLSRAVETANSELADANARLEQLLTRRHDQAERLAASAGNMRELIDQLPAPVIGIDPDGTIVFINGEAERLLDAADDLLGQSAARALWPTLFDTDGRLVEHACHVVHRGQALTALARPVVIEGQRRGNVLLLTPQ